MRSSAPNKGRGKIQKYLFGRAKGNAGEGKRLLETTLLLMALLPLFLRAAFLESPRDGNTCAALAPHVRQFFFFSHFFFLALQFFSFVFFLIKLRGTLTAGLYRITRRDAWVRAVCIVETRSANSAVAAAAASMLTLAHNVLVSSGLPIAPQNGQRWLARL